MANDSRETRAGFVWLVGLGSAAMYALTYIAQRSIHLNGLEVEYPGFLYRGPRPADSSLLKVELGLYLFASLALIFLYLLLLSRFRQDSRWTRSAAAAAIILPVLFNAGSLLGRPYFSSDVFSYIAQGYLADQPGTSPHTTPVSDTIVTPLGPQLSEFGWQGKLHGLTPYGALITNLQRLVYAATSEGDHVNVPLAILLLKSMMIVASLSSAALIWFILGKIAPAARMLGTLLYLWNPLVVVELAMEGHNDALMTMFVLATIAFALLMKPAAAGFSLMISSLTKFIPLMFGPPLAVFFWISHPSRARLLAMAAAGGLAGIGAAALLYLPYWEGADTFMNVRSFSQNFHASIPYLAYRGLQEMLSDQTAKNISSAIFGTIFLAVVAFWSLRIRTEDQLVESCAWISLLYVLIATPLLWPWYFAMPLALIALRPEGFLMAVVPVITLVGRLVAPLADLHDNGFVTIDFARNTNAIVAGLVPLLFLLALKAVKIGSNPCLGRSST